MSMFPQSNRPEQNKPYRVKIYKRQRALLRNFIKVKGIDTRNQLHIQYKAYRNLIVFLIKKSKASFYSEYFQLHLRKIWRVSSKYFRQEINLLNLD